MTSDARSSDATTTVPPARPARAPLAGAPPGRRGPTAPDLFWVGLIALVVLSLATDRPEGVALALIIVAVVALRVRARRATEPDDEPATEEIPVLPESVDGAGRDGMARPRPVVAVAVLALLQIPVLVGIGAISLVFIEALLSPTGGATPPRVAAVVGVLVLAAIPSLVAAVGVWRGSEDARSSLLGLCRTRIGLSALACLTIVTLASPVALIVIDHLMHGRLEDPRTVRWCALSPAPGPGSLQH